MKIINQFDKMDNIMSDVVSTDLFLDKIPDNPITFPLGELARGQTLIERKVLRSKLDPATLVVQFQMQFDDGKKWIPSITINGVVNDAVINIPIIDKDIKAWKLQYTGTAITTVSGGANRWLTKTASTGRWFTFIGEESTMSWSELLTYINQNVELLKQQIRIKFPKINDQDIQTMVTEIISTVSQQTGNVPFDNTFITLTNAETQTQDLVDKQWNAVWQNSKQNWLDASDDGVWMFTSDDITDMEEPPLNKVVQSWSCPSVIFTRDDANGTEFALSQWPFISGGTNANPNIQNGKNIFTEPLTQDTMTANIDSGDYDKVPGCKYYIPDFSYGPDRNINELPTGDTQIFNKISTYVKLDDANWVYQTEKGDITQHLQRLGYKWTDQDASGTQLDMFTDAFGPIPVPFFMNWTTDINYILIMMDIDTMYDEEVIANAYGSPTGNIQINIPCKYITPNMLNSDTADQMEIFISRFKTAIKELDIALKTDISNAKTTSTQWATIVDTVLDEMDNGVTLDFTKTYADGTTYKSLIIITKILAMFHQYWTIPAIKQLNDLLSTFEMYNINASSNDIKQFSSALSSLTLAILSEINQATNTIDNLINNMRFFNALIDTNGVTNTIQRIIARWGNTLKSLVASIGAHADTLLYSDNSSLGLGVLSGLFASVETSITSILGSIGNILSHPENIPADLLDIFNDIANFVLNLFFPKMSNVVHKWQHDIPSLSSYDPSVISNINTGYVPITYDDPSYVGQKFPYYINFGEGGIFLYSPNNDLSSTYVFPNLHAPKTRLYYAKYLSLYDGEKVPTFNDIYPVDMMLAWKDNIKVALDQNYKLASIILAQFMLLSFYNAIPTFDQKTPIQLNWEQIWRLSNQQGYIGTALNNLTDWVMRFVDHLTPLPPITIYVDSVSTKAASDYFNSLFDMPIFIRKQFDNSLLYDVENVILMNPRKAIVSNEKQLVKANGQNDSFEPIVFELSLMSDSKYNKEILTAFISGVMITILIAGFAYLTTAEIGPEGAPMMKKYPTIRSGMARVGAELTLFPFTAGFKTGDELFNDLTTLTEGLANDILGISGKVTDVDGLIRSMDKSLNDKLDLILKEIDGSPKIVQAPLSGRIYKGRKKR